MRFSTLVLGDTKKEREEILSSFSLTNSVAFAQKRESFMLANYVDFFVRAHGIDLSNKSVILDQPQILHCMLGKMERERADDCAHPDNRLRRLKSVDSVHA